MTDEEKRTAESDLPDEENFGEIVKPTSKKRLNVVVSIRFDPGELKAIREVIGDNNLSSFVRESVLKAVNKGSTTLPEAIAQSSSHSDVKIFTATAIASAPDSFRLVTHTVTPAVPRLTAAS